MSILDKTHRPVRSTRQLLGVRCLADGCADTANGLLALDAGHLEDLRASLATARQFCLAIRLRSRQDSGLQAHLARVEKSIRDSGFRLHRANDQELRRLLALYFEQDVTTTYFEEIDGERFVIERGELHEENVEKTEDGGQSTAGPEQIY